MNCLRQIKIRDEAESLKELNKNLQSILDSMSLGQGFVTTNEVLILHIKQQSIEIVKINKQREELLFNLENKIPH
jgi:hypothetical protein